jgi:hypothetical protein
VRGLERRIDRFARNVSGVDSERVWAWRRAMAAIIAAGKVARRHKDPGGEFLLAFAAR